MTDTLIRPADLSPKDAYFLMTGCIVPRPIAWVTTLSGEGVLNLAPFSYFNGISTRPPLLGISVARRRDGSQKDTARNILASGEFVVHAVAVEQEETCVASGEDLPPDRSEVEHLGLTPVESATVAVPGIAEAPLRMECRLERCLELGDGPVDYVIGEVLAYRFREGVYSAERGLDPSAWVPLGRLGGTFSR